MPHFTRYFLLILFIGANSLFAQNKKDSNGKKQGKWVSRNHKIEFMTIVEAIVKYHIQDSVINNEDDLHKYLRINHYTPSSGEGGGFSWCVCSHDINNICIAEIYFGDTVYGKIQIGCVCINKIGNKILSDQLCYRLVRERQK